jgi:hypothetical protein
MACSWRVSCSLDAPASLEASIVWRHWSGQVDDPANSYVMEPVVLTIGPAVGLTNVKL